MSYRREMDNFANSLASIETKVFGLEFYQDKPLVARIKKLEQDYRILDRMFWSLDARVEELEKNKEP